MIDEQLAVDVELFGKSKDTNFQTRFLVRGNALISSKSSKPAVHVAVIAMLFAWMVRRSSLESHVGQLTRREHYPL